MIQYETRGHRRTREQGGKEGREGKGGKWRDSGKGWSYKYTKGVY
jgi:hypothetical protein